MIVDIYTAQEEAYKRGFEAGQNVRWHKGREVPRNIRRALLQKSGGRVFYLENIYLDRAVEAWNDVIAWAAVEPMPE